MPQAKNTAPAATAEQAPGDSTTSYSKDYWDLVLEQLLKHGLFKLGLAVLALLYGLAIFAPLISNDRPYKLVAIDYGAYQSSLRGIEGIGGRAIADLQAVGEMKDSEQLAQTLGRAAQKLGAVSTNLDTMQLYLASSEVATLETLEDGLRAALSAAEGGTALSAEDAAVLKGELSQVAAAYQPLRGEAGEVPAGEGQRLVAHTSYPLPSSVSWFSLFFMAVWVLGVSFPVWNRLWNRRLLGGDRQAIRQARSKKWAVLLLLPVALSALWGVLVQGDGGAFDVAPYKQGLTSGEIVPVEAPLMALVPYGYAEQHREESFRPPTWLHGAELDANGYYLHGLRQPKADAVTGYLPPPTPTEVRFGEPWPNAPHRHPAGTDELGRDFFVRMLWGGRVSLAVGIVSATLLTLIGVVMGAMAGYFGGWVDTTIMRLIEILQSIPAFFLILATMAFTDPDVVPPIIAIVVVIALVRWTGAARLVRGEFLRLRDQEFVVASRALGFSSWRTIFRHVLPNAMSPVLVNAAFSVAAGILTESAVSFLGFGVSHPDASWGSLVNESRSPDHWWIQVFPGLLIFLTVTCYNLVGDAVRDALDPKMKV